MKSWITFLLAFVMSAMAADVKPFVFDGIPSDSATQQAEFEYMLQYKLFGRDYMRIGNDVTINDKSGWNGTRGDLSVTNRLSLGGPVLVTGDIVLGDGNKFVTGPVRASSMTIGNDNGSYFAGTVVLPTDPGQTVRNIITRSGGEYVASSDQVPPAPATLSIPVIEWPDTISGANDIRISANNGVAYIDIPDGDGTYDLYINEITTGIGGTDGSKVYVRMQDGGRLTRIFVRNLSIGNHTTINVVYRTSDGDEIQSQKSYRGNLMFYTDSDITFERTDNVPIQGSFLTTGKLYLACNLDFAGQLLANQLEIGNTFNGENFRFVPFDPDTLDFDPELDRHGGLLENDSTVIIPIRLSDTATVGVYFKYCFDLRDGVTVDDFNLVTDFPVCGVDEPKTVYIPSGKKDPVEPIRINVKKDTITEPSDYLVMKISIESGAVLPNNKTDGELKVRIMDAVVSRKVAFDTTATYSEPENWSGVVDRIRILNGSDSTRFVLDSAYTGRYSLDPVTGELTLLTPVDYETVVTDTIKVTLKDTGDVSVTGYIPVAIIDMNEAPEITTTKVEFSENLPVPAKIGKIAWSDVDTRSAFRDNVVDVLVPADGITVQPDGTVYATSVFDYEAGPRELNVTVRVYDRTDPSLADTATVKLVLGDIDESPSVRDTTFTVTENTVGTVGTLVAKDPEGKGLTYTIVETGSGFTIDSKGKISNTVPFNYEKEKSKTIQVRVSDGTLATVATVRINIADVNEPVHAHDTTLAVDEHTTGHIGKVKAEDEDGTAVRFHSGDTVHYTVDSVTGDIGLVTPFDYNLTKADTLLVYVTDGEFTDTAKVIVNVNNVNEAPVLQPNDSLAVQENCKACVVGQVTAVDPDHDPILYTVDDPRFYIDSVGKIVTRVPLDYETERTVKVKVTATDPSGTGDTMTYTVKVVDVNEPVHARDTSVSVDEHSTGVIGKVSGTDEDGKPVTFSAIGDTVRFTVDLVTGEVTLNIPYNYNTATGDTLLVLVTDGVFSDTAKVTIRVNDLNSPPVLQPNDSLSVTENCRECTVGKVTAVDPDSDLVTYSVITPGFTIDSTGTIRVKEPLDYESDSIVKVTVTATDPSGAGDTVTYTVRVTDVNEPVHVKDTSCTVAENSTGKTGCRVPAWDEDSTKPKYTVDDTTRFSIDPSGEITVKIPFDYETTPADTVRVFVTDGEFTDTATVVIRVADVPEIATITEVDHQPKRDTLRTNDPDHIIEYSICEMDRCTVDSIAVETHRDTTVKVCNEMRTSCDEVTILFNDALPVVLLTNAHSTSGVIDFITIEEKKDGGIYVNRKSNDLKVTVKDTVHHTEKSFDIGVTLDTVHVKPGHIKEYGYVIDETNATVTPVGNGRGEMKEVIKVDGVEVTISKIVELGTLHPVDTVQTVTYTTTENGREITVSYRTDNLTGQRVSDYTVSYMVDSCTTVSYYLDDRKQVVKNNEGNISYTVAYSYTDDFGNVASARVDIVYDDIPPVVEILSPESNASFNTNAITVKWTVNGIEQDTLTLQRLEKGPNMIVRKYVDKAGNESLDTVFVWMKEAKDIDVNIVHPVTVVDKEKVEEYYSDGHKYDQKKPYRLQVTDPATGKLPETIGVGFKVDIALPSVSATGGLATLDDIVRGGMIPVDDDGNVVGASTKGIPVDRYVEEHCTDEFKEEYKNNGLVGLPLYNVKFSLHLWVYTTQANYVNNFYVEYDLNDHAKATEAGTVQMVVDWLADRDGNVKAKNGKALGTSSYITKLYSKSIARHRCDYKEQTKGDVTIKKEDDIVIFGYKRPHK